MPTYSLVENLDWLRENKQLFLDLLDSKLDAPSGLTISSSWDSIVAYINKLPTYIIEWIEGAVEELERFLNNNIEKTIEVTSTTIIPYAFMGKSSLKRFIGNNVVSVQNSAFRNCTNLESFISSSVTTVGEYTFQNTKLKTIATMPNLTTIGTQAFNNCNELTEVNLTNVTTVGSYAFMRSSGSSKLTNIIFGPNTAVNDYAFQGQNQLEPSLYLNCKSIGPYSFKSCSSIREIIITTDVITMNTYALYDIGSVNRILCEVVSKPSGWDTYWNYSNYPVYWNCSERDWVFKYNSQQEDTTFHGRIIDTLPIPEPKEGYEFDCWYTDNTLTTPVITPFALPNGNYPVLYAGWKIVTKVFIYDKENETTIYLGTMSFKSVEEIYNLKLDFTIDGVFIDTDFSIELTDLSQLLNLDDRVLYLTGFPKHELNFEYTGDVQSTILTPATYLLECWGAQGGNNSSTGGRGGYSVGKLTVTNQPVNIYVYVGGAGSNSSNASGGGFNGGTGTNNYGGCGGGASDIRLDTDSLYSRIIVAGGGGGAGHSNTVGGAGGGIVGLAGGAGSTVPGRGGEQTSGGTAASTSLYGKFGLGGANASNGGGAGGGWYGGGHGQGAGTDSGGGGGSGWVYTEESYKNWTENSVEGKSGSWQLNSTHYLIDASTSAGNTEFLSPDGINEVGHSGNGYVRITRWRQA